MGTPGFVFGPGGEGEGAGGDGLGEGTGGDGLGDGPGDGGGVDGQLLPQQQNLALFEYVPAQVEALPSYCRYPFQIVGPSLYTPPNAGRVSAPTTPQYSATFKACATVSI